MKLKNVYLGKTKDGKERVFYKSYSEYCGVNCTVCTDLKSKEKFTFEDVDIDDLVPFSKILPNRKRASRRKVVKVFKVESSSRIHPDNLYIGEIGYVEWVPDIAFSNSLYGKKNMSVSTNNEKIFLIKVDEDEYKDMAGNLYKTSGSISLQVGDKCVENVMKAAELLNLPKDRLVTKTYALRKYYSVYK